MVSVPQGLNVLKAENKAKCQGTPRLLATDPTKRTENEPGNHSLQGCSISSLGRVWPHSSESVWSPAHNIYGKRPSTVHDGTYRNRKQKQLMLLFIAHGGGKTWSHACLNTVWLRMNSLETKHQQLNGRPAVGFFSVDICSSGKSDRILEPRAARAFLGRGVSVSMCQWAIRPLVLR